MAPLKLKFTTLNVFTSKPFSGNPLAIVHIPADATVSQQAKQLIAREFNLSETVFLHDPSSAATSVTIDIFTTTRELRFAGHPTIGSAWYILSTNPTITQLQVKAGPIPISRSGLSAALDVPIDFKNHPPLPISKGPRTRQTEVRTDEYVYHTADGDAVVSIVKGMTFVLLGVASEDALARLQLPGGRTQLPLGYGGDGDREWITQFVGTYAFYLPPRGGAEEGGGRRLVRTRMFDGAVEDPATGSAASAFCCWLALGEGEGTWPFRIVQGVEMGRKSLIDVTVTVQGGKVQKVRLEGEACQVMVEGLVPVPEGV